MITSSDVHTIDKKARMHPEEMDVYGFLAIRKLLYKKTEFIIILVIGFLWMLRVYSSL